ncbi:MAG: hypothetical protein E6G85_14795 [Alphaproteobacteria bacterium]|nr:MAG: hypothetical protein E6G85_14795 [Alphaproteobacteria bacterium]
MAGLAAQARLELTVIVRLDRTIQYAAALREHRRRRRLLDAQLSRGMTGKQKAGSDPGLFFAVIARSETPKQSRLFAWHWIASLRSQ